MGILKDDNTVKESFRRVKEHILALEREVRANREFIIAQNSRIEALEKEILSQLKGIKEEKARIEIEVEPIREIEEDLVGNDEEKVISASKMNVNHSKGESPYERKGFLATPRRHHDSLSTGIRHSGTDSGSHFQTQDIEEIKQNLNKVFLTLTNREFKVFMAVYSLEEQHNSPTTYAELAQNLDLSASSIRDYISELVRKGAPLKKEKSRNGIAYVSVLPEFKSLNLISKLIAFRNMSNEQKSLFDSFF